MMASKNWGKNKLVFDLKRDKFNSELEAVEENSVSLTGRQASFRWPRMAYRKR